MGLGKSLLILSRIAASCTQAAEFAQAEENQNANEENQKIASKATLIVAPSTCRHLSIPSLLSVFD
jgi:hypothetical protein